MSARLDLLELYEQWRIWTRREGEAIEQGIWAQVNLCQDAKLKLQLDIVSVTDRWHREAQAQGKPPPTGDAQLRRVLDELIRMEMHNADVLADKRKQATVERDSMEQSKSRLRGIAKAYAPSREALWQSYS